MSTFFFFMKLLYELFFIVILRSISPKLRNKKQAPAPPQSSNLNPILQTSIVASINSLANEQGLFENENDSHSFNYIKNNETGFKLSSSK